MQTIQIFFMIYFQFQVIYSLHSLKVRDTSHILSREKRWLVWKPGVNWASVIFGIGIPVDNIEPAAVTLGMTMKAYYQLPNNSSYFTHPTIDFERKRKKRSVSRWTIYKFIEYHLERNNYPDGKACLLKSICEISSVRLEKRSGLLAEIVHSIFTPSTTNEEIEDYSNNAYHAAEKLGKELGVCDQLYPECPMDPIKQFSRFMTLGKSIF